MHEIQKIIIDWVGEFVENPRGVPRGQLSAAPHTAEEAVRDLADLLTAEVDPDEELSILGHSMGAYLGLGVAAALERRGGPRCQTLFASANLAPQLGSPLFADGTSAVSDEDVVGHPQRGGRRTGGARRRQAAGGVLRPGTRRRGGGLRVRRSLSVRLPGHMVPSVRSLPALPLTSSGKVDRRTLARGL
ncbi:hypothetical protein SCALM49S_06844 [Streptomyces californicus]